MIDTIYGKIKLSVSITQNIKLMKTITAFIAALVLTSGCNNRETSESFKAAESTTIASLAKDEATSGEEKSIQESVAVPGRVELKLPSKIIKNAQLQFQVKNMNESHSRILSCLKTYNAYIGSDNSSTSGYQLQSDIVIRVPSESFDMLLKDILKESIYTNYANTTTEDITAQFVDIEARMKTKKDVEQRYTALLREAKKNTGHTGHRRKVTCNTRGN
jgi:hypothetical protein